MSDSEATQSDEDELSVASDGDWSSPAAAAAAAATAAAAAAGDLPDWENETPFDSSECLESRLPIFRRRDIRVREPCATQTVKQLHDMTFAQYLDYYLAHPDYIKRAAHLLSDERYMCMLELCMSSKTVTEYCTENKVSASNKKWLFAQRRTSTHRYVLMEYAGHSVADMDKGPVLVCFVEPDPYAKRGQSFVARPASSRRLYGRRYGRCWVRISLTQTSRWDGTRWCG
jgi:hypothetical protein